MCVSADARGTSEKKELAIALGGARQRMMSGDATAAKKRNRNLMRCCYLFADVRKE
jgi:hypothetical protein